MWRLRLARDELRLCPPLPGDANYTLPYSHLANTFIYSNMLVVFLLDTHLGEGGGWCILLTMPKGRVQTFAVYVNYGIHLYHIYYG